MTNSLKDNILSKSKSRGFSEFNIENPKTWCEKIQWLKIYDNNKLWTKCADKILVHNYSDEKLGKDICVPIIKVYRSPEEINFSSLPNSFVLKCNHGWNMNIVVNNKNNEKEDVCISKLKEWLQTPFGEKSLEPHYLDISRKCFAETYIGTPLDYKFWCFNGNPLMCTVNSNIGSNGARNYWINWYDMEWNLLPYSRIDHPNNPKKTDIKPTQFKQMKEYAIKLSQDFRFVRVDFYEVDEVVYLGELTFTPATGFIKWTNPSVDRMFGDMIKL